MMAKLLVPEMSCKHCVMKIEKALKDHHLTGKVDLATKTVTTEQPSEAMAAMEKVGYSSELSK